ncbi:MAG TPA: DUF4157 domain-containing protein [Pyrinomonadaceae bacterium]|nr:DUF4157 domain-containing protein [Pyrinomonadaceae bacterium]
MRKLAIGASNDPLEQEADQIADQALAAPKPAGSRRTPLRIQRFTGSISGPAESAPESVERALAGSGRPLDASLRQDMEQRFGHDFSRVRVHSGGVAEQSAREVNARAYTVGHNIVFGAGRFMPGTQTGRRLLAHELTHVVQQSSQLSRKLIQRCPDPAMDAAYDAKAAAVKAHPEYVKLPVVATDLEPGTKATADEIIVNAKAKTNCLDFIAKLKDLFDLPVKPPATIGAATKAATATAVGAEKKRMATPQAKAKEKLEESTSASATLVKRPGTSGGNYYVDARDPNNIVVKATIMLTKKGGGTDKDVESIEAMEDAIEKRASTRGYLVDIEFVKVADADTFKVDVDTDRWEYSTNWSGGEPQGFAHELHHLLAFPLDRYNYIEVHGQNDSMNISNRVLWFRKELTKPAGFNDPTSIMSRTMPNPNDDDACRVAGLNVANCVAAREKVNKAFAEIVKASQTPEERILNTITRYRQADVDTMMGVLREILRSLFGLPAAKTVAKRLADKGDALGQVFQKLTGAQQKELLKIVQP